MKILFPGHEWGDLTTRLKQNLPDCELVHCPQEDVLSNLGGVEVIIPAMTRITRDIIEAAPDLRMIHQAGVGLEGIDIEAATRRKIPVANVPSAGSGNAESVAELAVLHVLLLLRRYHEAVENFGKRIWGQPLGSTLYGKTVGIIGVGNIGRTVARRLKPFGIEMLGIDPMASPQLQAEYGFDWLNKGDLDHLLAHSDVVVLCAAFRPELKDMIGRAQFQRMKPTAYLVNVARGGFVEPAALAEALEAKTIAGVGLDVFWQEPVDPTEPIFGQNVIATPHIGAATDTGYGGIAARLAENVRRLQKGERIQSCANADGVYA